MKATVSRLSREQAKELLVRLDSAIGGAIGKGARYFFFFNVKASFEMYTWVGVYVVEGNDLVLDAWAGPAATEHTRIPVDKGVCGFVAKAGRTEIVSDVGKDPRYLQCFLSTKSEIVVPILSQGSVVGEIDIDGDQLDAFSSLDGEFLEAVARKAASVWAP